MARTGDGPTLLAADELIRTNDLDQAAWNYKGLLGWIQRQRFSMAADALPGHVGTLLEVGYGSGVFMPELARRCDELHGADVHAKNSEVAEVLARREIEASLVVAPADDLPYADDTFDAVVSVSALEFVDDVDASCQEMSRVTKPGGTVVVITPGYSKLLDLGLRVLAGERAEDTFQGRRQLVLPALRSAFHQTAAPRFPRFSPVWLYTAFSGRAPGD